MHRSAAATQALARAVRGRARCGAWARYASRGVLACVAACAAALAAAAEPTPNPVHEPDRVWAFDGFALRPPPGEAWFSLMKSRERVVFAKRVSDPAYGFVAVASSELLGEAPASADALLSHIRTRRPRTPDPDRYELVERAESLEDDAPPWCVRYRLRAEDSRASRFYPHIVRIAGRACLHPDRARLVIDASYAEWALEGAERPAAHAEGEAFLAALRTTGASAVVADADALASEGAVAQAVDLLTPLAAGGDALAALRLGAAYERGRGVAADPAAASRWYRIAADAGEVDALYNLGAIHARGVGVVRDVGEAVLWFRRAADQRDAQAQLNLGLLYLTGDGVAPDRAAARYWLALASANGSARARALLDELAQAPMPGSERGVR